MTSPKFNPHDNIVYIGDKPYRYNQPEFPICYIVSGYSPTLFRYYVRRPGDVKVEVHTQYDLEINFRLAEEWEVELYFA